VLLGGRVFAVAGCDQRSGPGVAEGDELVAEQPGLSFGGLLRQLRADALLTQEELADAAGLSQRSVSDLERGINRTARKDTAVLLADALGLAARVRELFVAAALGRVPVAEVIAAWEGAAAGASAPLSNLPVELSAFIGRDRELAEVRALVKSSRLVTLTGAGGAGKTRLGLQAAGALLDGFGDGVWLVELAAVTGQEAVAPAIAGALRLAAQPGRPVLEALVDALATQDLLIVLDNCEHVIGACAEAAEVILRRCPRVRLVATSREPLGIGGETVYRVPSLSLPGPGEPRSWAAGSFDAVALFADRARRQGAALNADEETAPLVVSVCRRLDGMPLAIELAAARMRSMSLTELAGRLDQRFRLLTGGSRTALERQQTLRAAVSWSYELLTGPEQVLLARLSVFADGFDLAAAEGVCGSGDFEMLDVADLLGSLVDKSLVAAEPAGAALRYRLLETIRLFAAERLAEAGEAEAAAVGAAHCTHFLSVAETAAAYLNGPEQGGWLARLDADMANLRRAAAHAAGDPNGTALVLRLGVALDNYWWARARLQEARELLMPALERPDADDDAALFAAALCVAAGANWFRDAATSRQFAEEAVQVARRLDEDRLLIRALAALCFSCVFAGEPETGLPFGQESVQRGRQLGDDVELAYSLVAYISAVGPAVSLQLTGEAIACTERSGDVHQSYYLRANAGWYALSTGDTPAARTHLEAAQRAAQALGIQNPIAAMNLAMVLREEGDRDGAQSMLESALRTSRRNGDNRDIAGACTFLACLAGDRGDWSQAAMLHGAAQAVQDRTKVPWDELDARYRQDSLAQARARLGDKQLDQAYAYGMTFSLEQVLELALSRTSSA
jgi:predicted ATPase/DNA-binding XRE family transcriptional regulator